MILPGTDESNALAVAERLRSQVRQCKVRMGSDLWDLTASIGMAHCTVAARVMDIMLSAEAAMNEAARLGGDAVGVGQPMQEPVGLARSCSRPIRGHSGRHELAGQKIWENLATASCPAARRCESFTVYCATVPASTADLIANLCRRNDASIWPDTRLTILGQQHLILPIE